MKVWIVFKSSGFLSLEKHPFLSEDFSILMTVGQGTFVFVILLMVVLGSPESGSRFQHGGHPVSLLCQYINILLRDLFFAGI